MLENIKVTRTPLYEVDFTKVKTIEDVIAILKGLDIRVYEDYQKFEELKPFLKKSDE